MKHFMHTFMMSLPFLILLGSGENNPLKAQESGWFLYPSFFYQTREFEFQPTWTGNGFTREWLKINASVGLATSGGLLLGVKYFNDKKTTKSQGASSSSDVVEEVEAAGPGVGFMFGNLSLFLSLMLAEAPERTYTPAKITMKGGSGTMFDLSYLIDLGGWYIGPQLTWYSFEYKKLIDQSNPSSAAVTEFTRADETGIDPYLAFFFYF